MGYIAPKPVMPRKKAQPKTDNNPILRSYPSKSRKGEFNNIRQSVSDGSVYCDCWAWKRSVKSPKTCAHLEAYSEFISAKANMSVGILHPQDSSRFPEVTRNASDQLIENLTEDLENEKTAKLEATRDLLALKKAALNFRNWVTRHMQLDSAAKAQEWNDIYRDFGKAIDGDIEVDSAEMQKLALEEAVKQMDAMMAAYKKHILGQPPAMSPPFLPSNPFGPPPGMLPYVAPQWMPAGQPIWGIGGITVGDDPNPGITIS